MADKEALRAQVRLREEALTPEERRESDRALCRQFLSHPRVARAETLLLFAGMGLEVDTRPLLEALERQGKRLYLPRCLPGGALEARRYDPRRLVRHRYGMLEPDEGCEEVDKAELDLILVPALCYDRRCFRLGRGGGYYDRYLAGYTGVTLGLCRQALLWDAVPVEPWDRGVDVVLTEREQFGRGTAPGPVL